MRRLRLPSFDFTWLFLNSSPSVTPWKASKCGGGDVVVFLLISRNFFLNSLPSVTPWKASKCGGGDVVVFLLISRNFFSNSLPSVTPWKASKCGGVVVFLLISRNSFRIHYHQWHLVKFPNASSSFFWFHVILKSKPHNLRFSFEEQQEPPNPFKRLTPDAP